MKIITRFYRIFSTDTDRFIRVLLSALRFDWLSGINCRKKISSASSDTDTQVNYTEKLRHIFFGISPNLSTLFFKTVCANKTEEYGPNPNSTVTTDSPHSTSIKVEDLHQGFIIMERYELIYKLGHGGMSVVWKAKDNFLNNKEIAIKFLGDSNLSTNLLKNEIQSATECKHSNIVTIHHFEENSGTPFITMEHIEGTPLDKLKKTNVIKRKEAWGILENISSGISCIHNEGFIHADIKPENIMITQSGIAKILDFGIARAKVTRDSSSKILECGGSENACSPKYASKDVLNGKNPEQIDDVYSLGCVAYELLSGGTSPFGDYNAIEAESAGLKPKRINNLSKKQWKALKLTLNFERKGRIKSVKYFWEKIDPEAPRNSKYLSSSTLLLALLFYPTLFLLTPSSSIESEHVISSFKSAFSANLELEEATNNLNSLLNTPAFDSRWESSLLSTLNAISELTGSDHSIVLDAKRSISNTYMSQIKLNTKDKRYQEAERLTLQARAFSSDSRELDKLERLIDTGISEQNKRSAAQDKRNQKQNLESRKMKKFENILTNIHSDLRCNRLLDMDDFSGKIDTLKALSTSSYNKAKPLIVKKLSNCIAKITEQFPQRGLKIKSSAEVFFESRNLFRTSLPHHQNACSRSLAGLGSQGFSSRCQDHFIGGSKGPVTVVIPGFNQVKPFAIGRYEVSVDEFNQFCFTSKKCPVSDTSNTSLPVTSVPSSTITEYLSWLSAQSGKTYRLPTLQEWSHVAGTNKGRLEKNAPNCLDSAKEIEKQNKLTPSGVGQQNEWGVVNVIGNAREWVLDGRKLLSVGESPTTTPGNCGSEYKVNDNKNFKKSTGFRIVREL